MPTATIAPAKTSIISLNQIDIPSDARPRDPAALEILAHDMGVQGQLQEIVVIRRDGESGSGSGKYEVIAGVGRTLAARKLGWKEIRASVREGVSDFDRARITFAENEDREDVDPFYQAGLIEKMLRSKGCSHRDLAEGLGISASLVDAYIAIDDLPGEIRKMPKRLGIGQLIQIVRLNNTDSKIEFAQNCAKNDLSVRQLKALVDRALKKPSRARALPPSRPPSLPDPLANEWESIQSKLMQAAGDAYWIVKYGSHKLPTKDSINGWYFFISPQVGEGASKPGLVRWFRQMLQALEGDKVENDFDALRQEMQAARSKLADSMERPAADNVFGGPVRLPKNAEEKKELEAIALRGNPIDVYAWIYAKDSPMLKMAPASWQEVNTTPTEGLKQLLEGIRELQKIST